MSKKLNIIEVLNSNVGTEYEATTPKGYKYKCVVKLYQDNKMLIDSKNGNKIDFLNDFVINTTFIPVQKPVSFMRAVESGNRIKVEHNLIDDAILNKKDIYFRSDSPHNRKALEMFRRKEFMSPNLLFSALGYLFDGSEIAEIVNNGKWYIEEE